MISGTISESNGVAPVLPALIAVAGDSASANAFCGNYPLTVGSDRSTMDLWAINSSITI
jgi:hypothetical protein